MSPERQRCHPMIEVTSCASDGDGLRDGQYPRLVATAQKSTVGRLPNGYFSCASIQAVRFGSQSRMACTCPVQVVAVGPS